MADGFNILIVGLGIMGGSLAKSLKGFKKGSVFAVDKSPEVIARAVDEGVIADGGCDAEKFLPDSDLVIVCLYPEQTVEFINKNKFKKGAVVTDICGVKQYVLQNVENNDVDYIGGHPMAGRELSGYQASVADLFKNAFYILTPTEKTTSYAISLMREVAEYIGCRGINITTPENHDEMIAYTSQLMHVVAVALCDNELLSSAEGYSAGSLRDCTRVANLNSVMWAELFMKNKKELTKMIDRFEASMDEIKKHLASDNEEGLVEFLEGAAERKRNFLS